MSAVTPRTGRERLDPEIFELPVDKMRDGYYSDAYFNHTRAALLHDDRRPRVVTQVFQRKHAMLGGMDESIAILKLCSHDWDALNVHALHDGDRVEPWETVMTIEGDYTAFAHLETVVLGTLARRTLISSQRAWPVKALALKSRVRLNCPFVTGALVTVRSGPIWLPAPAESNKAKLKS